MKLSRRLVATLPIGIATLGALLAPATQAQNLIVNGSFEEPALPHENNTITAGPIPGWTAIGHELEVGYAPTYVIGGYDGFQVCELDSDGNYTLRQTISGLSAGAVYNLSFLGALRTSDLFLPDTGAFDVRWNGQLVGSYSPTFDFMSFNTLSLTGIAGSNVLDFVGAGASDGGGPILDNVVLLGPSVTTPEPGSAPLLGIVSLPLVGMVLARCRRFLSAVH